uniref:SUEL-type lectin domain-containing protein n=1 Tax=Romanomermis culicivorax TaxID=13658 RepID=A0A915IV93_ROMCU
CIINTKDELITDCHGKYTCSFNVSEEKFGSLQHCEGMGPRTLNLIHICVDEKVFPNYLDPTTEASSTQQKTFHKVWSEKLPELETENSTTVGGNLPKISVSDGK